MLYSGLLHSLVPVIGGVLRLHRVERVWVVEVMGAGSVGKRVLVPSSDRLSGFSRVLLVDFD